MTSIIRALRQIPLRFRALTLVFGVALFGGIAVRAELVVLSGGRVLHVRSAAPVGNRMRLVLDNSGELILPLDQVEHVVADEIDHRPRPAWLPSLQVDVRFDRHRSSAPATPYGSLILSAARSHGLNPELVAAVVEAESAFRPSAVSRRGAIGLMQVMPATGLRFGVQPARLRDPEVNLSAGTRYLRWLADHFDDDLPRILAGYNAGEGVVERYQGVPPYRETHDYILKVYRLLSGEGQDTSR